MEEDEVGIYKQVQTIVAKFIYIYLLFNQHVKLVYRVLLILYETLNVNDFYAERIEPRCRNAVCYGLINKQETLPRPPVYNLERVASRLTEHWPYICG